MPGETKAGMPCAEFETLIADALDGLLRGPKLESFRAHRASCPHCAPLFHEAEAGLNWLMALKAETVEPPARLLGNILRATTGAAEVREKKSWIERLRELPILAPVFQTVQQPRFALSFGMAFFCFSFLLNASGMKVRDLRYLDLSPSALVRAYYVSEGKVVRLYENMRFVNEMESRVRDLKRAAAPEEQPQPEKPQHPKNPDDSNTTGVPSNAAGAPLLAMRPRRPGVFADRRYA